MELPINRDWSGPSPLCCHSDAAKPQVTPRFPQAPALDLNENGICLLKMALVSITQTGREMSLGGGEAEFEVGWMERVKW